MNELIKKLEFNITQLSVMEQQLESTPESMSVQEQQQMVSALMEKMKLSMSLLNMMEAELESTSERSQQQEWEEELQAWETQPQYDESVASAEEFATVKRIARLRREIRLLKLQEEIRNDLKNLRRMT